MPPHIQNIRFASLAFATFAVASLAIAPAPASAQTEGATFRVLIDGAMVGTATAAANLPKDAVVMTRNAAPDTSTAQIASGTQATIMLTTADPALIAAAQAWMKADNSGFKNTVQRKTVEIDRVLGSGPTSRFRLSGAWPSRIDHAGDNTMITFVYQRLNRVPQR